jgi:hypothetical protein
MARRGGLMNPTMRDQVTDKWQLFVTAIKL